MLRLDQMGNDAGYEVSIALPHAIRGFGYGKKIIGKAIALYPRKDLYATIHSDNIASIRLFEGLGFIGWGTEGDPFKVWRRQCASAS